MSCLPSAAVNSRAAPPASTGLSSESQLAKPASAKHSNNGVGDVGVNGTRLVHGEAPQAHVGGDELGSDAQRTISATQQKCTGTVPAASISSSSTPGNDLNLSSPRTQRKKIKKREFGFFYADDDKQQPPSSSGNPPVDETKTIATKPKASNKRKRSRHVPVKDSLLIEVPMSITADMGVAMRRTRRKRSERIRNWLASGEDAKKQALTTTAATTSPKPDDEDNGDGDQSIEGCSFDEDGGPKRGSIEYLEAKYVRGVMIDDFDERAARESEESEGDGSVYGNDDFIDDSLLQEEVAGQVLASSTYGRTQMEEEQARRRLEDQNKKAEADGTNAAGGPNIEGLGGSDDESVGSSNAAVYDKAFDDGFFVNVGDLDMAEGWAGEDFGMSPTKKRKKKKLVGKAKEKAVTKKGTKAKHVLPTKKKLLKDGKKKAEDKSSTAKTKKKKKADVTPKKKQSASADESSVEEKFTPASSSKKTAKPVSKEKENVTQLRKLYKRKYNICIKLIKDLTPQQLPRKPRKSTIKLLVNIPPGKKVGDNITFQNPNVAGQKLKAAIPKDADMEKLTMIVRIPMPAKVTEKKDNVFPKELKDALLNYSNAYDDFCLAEQEYNEALPPSKRKSFKASSQRLKMFDDMLVEFPRNLATPIDATFMRKNVRQEKSNRARRESRAKTCSETRQVDVLVPQKGNEFSVATFRRQDFEEK